MLAHSQNKSKAPVGDWGYCLLCIVLICMAGFSYKLGGDKFAYMEKFEEIDNSLSLKQYILETFNSSTYMPIWSILNWVCCKWGLTFYGVQIIQACITNICVFIFAKHFTDNKYLFVFLYFISITFFALNTEVMREGMAVGFGLMACMACDKHQYGKYAIFVLIAFLCHLSALILLFFPLMNFKISLKKYTILWLIISYFCWSASIIINSHFFDQNSFLSLLQDKATTYLMVQTNIFGFISNCIQFIILPSGVFYYVIHQANISKNKIKRYIFFTIAIGALATFLPGLTRFRNYTIIFYLAMIANFLPTLFCEKKFLIVRSTIILCLLFYTTHYCLLYYPETQKRHYQRYVPYSNIINKDQINVDFREELHDESLRLHDN